MKIAQFAYKNLPCEARLGLIIGDKGDEKILDVQKSDPSLPRTLLEVLQKHELDRLIDLESSHRATIPLGSVVLKAPIQGMDKVLCIGMNYADSCPPSERKAVPLYFSKFSSTVVGPGEPVRIRTDTTEKVDYEAELCVVVGKEATNLSVENAMDCLLGCTAAQDITARDWQHDKNLGQFLLGKAMDTFCPIGPWIVTMDEIGDIGNLDIKCSVNGVQRQKSNTSHLIYSIPHIISRVSSVMTLYPGDIVLTGTPAGVGASRKPPLFMKPGDVVVTEIQNIGPLETRFRKFDHNYSYNCSKKGWH